MIRPCMKYIIDMSSRVINDLEGKERDWEDEVMTVERTWVDDGVWDQTVEDPWR